jgi:hypothetical protein
MKKTGFIALLLLTACFFTRVTAQNVQSVFSEVKIYDNHNGTGTVEAKVNPQVSGSMRVSEMRLRGNRVGGFCVLSGMARTLPWGYAAGNGNSVMLIANFPMVPGSGSGPEFLDLEVDVLYLTGGSGGHYISDSFSASHAVRDR